jgi:tetratricopeptide (TPR) repeat protein
MAFSLSQYNLAVEYWDMSTSKDEENYKFAQMQLKGFPDNISLLFSTQNYSKIVEEYSRYNGKLSDDVLIIVIQALFFANQRDRGFNEIINIHSAAQFEKIIQSCSSCLDSKERAILSICQQVSVIFNETWNKTLKLVDSAKKENTNPLYIAIALARTEGLPGQSSSIQKPIYDFLEKEFIIKFENVPDSLVFDIGTAIEKAGRRTHALRYYEMAIKRFADNVENERICVERWIHTKEIHAQHSGSKEANKLKQEATEKRREYGINEKKIDDFIALDGESSVIKYIIDNENKKKSVEIKPPKVTVKTHPENHGVNNDRNVKQKVEFELEGYKFAYFTEARRLNVESNTDGKTISLQHSDQKFVTQDFNITDVISADIGDCQKIEETPICFCITTEKITLSFENTKVVMHFL